MAIYFRTWKMAVAGLVALLHDLVITVGIYALFGFEVTPATMIGFLTILGYSLYDTVVVFDKVRENTAEAFLTRRVTYTQAANLAVNQTLVRSINTTVVALLPDRRDPRRRLHAARPGHPARPRARPVRRHRRRRLLVDLHRHAAAGRPAPERDGRQGARQGGAAVPVRASRCRPARRGAAPRARPTPEDAPPDAAVDGAAEDGEISDTAGRIVARGPQVGQQRPPEPAAPRPPKSKR